MGPKFLLWLLLCLLSLLPLNCVCQDQNFSAYDNVTSFSCNDTAALERIVLTSQCGLILSPCYPNPLTPSVETGTKVWHLDPRHDLNLPVVGYQFNFNDFETEKNGGNLIFSAMRDEENATSVTSSFFVLSGNTSEPGGLHVASEDDVLYSGGLLELDEQILYISFNSSNITTTTGNSFNITYCADFDQCHQNYIPALCNISNSNCSRNGFQNYSCDCFEGYTGPNCSADVDECKEANGVCVNLAVCTNTFGSFSCECDSGFNGDGINSCEDIDECSGNESNCDENADCFNAVGSFTCACKSGYSGNGVNCQLFILLTNFTIVAMQDSSSSNLSVDFDVSSPFGSDPSYVTDYVITLTNTETNTSTNRTTNTVNATNFLPVVIQVIPSTTYQIEVLVGNTGSSYTTAIIKLDAESLTVESGSNVPSAPGSLEVTSSSSETITVTWTAPTQGNQDVSNYTITYIQTDSSYFGETADNGTVLTTGPQVTTIMVTGLRAYRLYNVSVAAQNSAGLGPAEYGSIQTAEAVPQGPVVDLNVSVQTYNLTLNFLPPKIVTGLFMYDVEFTVNGEIQNRTGNMTSITLTELTPATVYILTVYPRTTAGRGPGSTVNGTTAEDVPGPVNSLEGEAESSTSIRISWEPPSSPNGVITQYRLTWILASGGESATASVGTNTSFVIASLNFYTAYNVTVFSSTVVGEGEGTSLFLTTLTEAPQGPVLNLNVTPQAHSVIFSFDPPTLVTGMFSYDVVYTVNGESKTLTTNESPVTVTGVVPATTYLFSIYPKTTAGRGPVTAVNVTTVEGVPGSVSNLTLETQSSTSIRASWQPPVSPNGIILQYRVSWLPVSGGSTASATVGTNTSFLITLLSVYTEYTVNVYANTNVGEDEGSSLTMRTQAGAPAGPVQAVTLAETQPNNATLEITAPEVITGIFTYDISCNMVGNTEAVHAVTDAISPHVVLGLTPFTKYTCTIYPRSGGEAGTETFMYNFTSSQDRPGPPTNLQHNSLLVDGVTLSWQAPAVINGILTGYRVTWQPSPGSESFPTLSSSTLSYEVSSLKAYIEYTFSVFSSTAAGESLTAATVTLRTEEDTPTEVSNFMAVVNDNNTITVDFDPPASPNGAILFYTIIVRQDAADCAAFQDSACINFTEAITASSDRTYTTAVLTPYRLFTVECYANTSAGNGPSLSKRLRTKSTVPGKPQNLQIHVINATSINVTWEAPSPIAGLVSYTIILDPSTAEAQTETIVNSTKSLESILLKDLLADVSYEITITASTDAGDGLPSKVTLYKAPSVISGATPLAPLGTVGLQGVDARTAFSISNPCKRKHALFSEIGGAITSIEVIVKETTANAGSVPGVWSTSITEIPVPPYVAGEIACDDTTERKKRELSSDKNIYVVGSDTSCSVDDNLVCNGPLASNRSYQVAYRGTNKGGSSGLTSYGEAYVLPTQLAPVVLAEKCGSAEISIDGNAYTFNETLSPLVAYSVQRCNHSGYALASIMCNFSSSMNRSVFDVTTLTSVQCNNDSIKTITAQFNFETLSESSLSETLTELDLRTTALTSLTIDDTVATVEFISAVSNNTRNQEISKPNFEKILSISDHVSGAIQATSRDNQMPSSSEKLLKSVNTLAYQLQLNGGRFNYLGRNIAVQITDQENITEDIQFSPQIYDEGVDELIQPLSVQVPSEALKKASQLQEVSLERRRREVDNDTSLRMVVILHRSISFFLSSDKSDWIVSVEIENKKLTDVLVDITITYSYIDVRGGRNPNKNPLKVTFVNETCSFWDFSIDSWSTEGCCLVEDSNPPQCKCNHLSNFALILSIYEIPARVVHNLVSIVSCSFSIAFLTLTIICLLISTSFKSGRSTQILLHICGNLLLAYITFLAGIDKRDNLPRCIAGAIFLHYFLLSSWHWVAVYAHMLHKSFVISPTWKNYMLKSSIFAYGSPIFIVGINAAVTLPLSQHPDMPPVCGHENDQGTAVSSMLADNMCWLHGYSFYFSFVFPVFVLLAFVIVMYILILRALLKTDDQLSVLTTTKKQLGNSATITVFVFVVWIFGYFMVLSTDVYDFVLLKWFFGVTAVLQGFLMFLLLCVANEDVRKGWWPPVCCKEKRFNNTVAPSTEELQEQPRQSFDSSPM